MFATHVLGLSLWEGQRRILESVRKHRRTLVKSGHGLGKTNTLGILINETMTRHPECRIVTSASTYEQVRKTLWSEVRKLNARAVVPLGGELLETQWKMSDGSYASITAVDDPTALQGVHGPYVLVILDEAEGIKSNMWAAYDSLLSSANSRMIACFNPVTPSGYLFDACLNPAEWNVITLSCLDHPNVVSGEDVIPGAVTREWVDEMRSKYCRDGEEPAPAWYSRVLGEFPPAGSNTLVSMAALDALSDFVPDVMVPRSIGVDIARMGDDESVLTVLDEHRRVIAVESWRKVDLMETVGRILNAMQRHRVEARYVGVDVCGMGAGVSDRLREQGYKVTPVDFGEGPKGDYASILGRDMRFKNRRNEAHAVFQALVREKQISIPRQYAQTRADLASVIYGYASDGKFRVESKDEIRDRVRRSPDFGDSLLIALCATQTRRMAIL
tara:strand:- start:3061 stop:4392 length:1332 start_codon:yes stop_codon:yes gene_type:complete